MPTLAPDLEFARFCPILGVAQNVRKVQGPVIDLGVGLPGFLPAPHIVQAAVTAACEDNGAYGSSRGDEALLTAYLGYLRRSGISCYSANNLVAGLGAKHLLFSALRAIIRPGDKVVVPTPCWPTYFDIAALVGADVTRIPCCAATGYKMSPEALEGALTDEVRAVILNSPGNPTGAVYTTEELTSLAQVMRKRDIWIISDDVYQRFVFEMDRCPDLFSVAPDLAERIIKVDSASKLYGMPGWRVGMMAANERIAAAVTTLNSNSISNLPSVTAAAAAAAFSGDQSFSFAVRDRLFTRRQLLLAHLEAAPHISYSVPSGAFYLFLDISQTIGKRSQGKLITDDEVFCSVLLESHGVALIPGSFFGAPGHVRLTYSGDTGQVQSGALRLREFLSSIS
ncbi:pyridoxal phosphate-dependent aminotransferase [Paraburkholderia sp. EG287A]|uniref:pyridoxal phosphate-dependent aminotransferase n=1 Tax=unclassified Paraburkholderia TaxID=2615204 RepID=UPI0034D36FB8